jgi:predicted metal-dependent HD superfamily phosphohydrolase
MVTDELQARWAWLAVAVGNPPGISTIGDGLLASWTQPHRAYHDAVHLLAVLHRIEDLAEHATDLRAVRLAAWYHDAVYDGAPDDEERSAQRAATELGEAGLDPVVVAEVARLVRLTVHHDPAPDDRNGAVLCDADLAILAADPDAYAAYTNAVRREYRHVPDDAFRAGRAAVLQSLLDLPTLFRTPLGQSNWEARARANLGAELTGLRGT